MPKWPREGLALLALRIRLSHRSVDDDRASQSVAVQGCRDDADEATHAVPDQHGRAHEACVGDDGEDNLDLYYLQYFGP